MPTNPRLIAGVLLALLAGVFVACGARAPNAQPVADGGERPPRDRVMDGGERPPLQQWPDNPRPDAPNSLPLLRTIQTTYTLRGASIARDGKTLATAGGYFGPGRAELWNAETGARLTELPAGETEFMAVAFAPDGESVATASSDRLVRVWDRGTGRVKATCEGHANYVRSVVFSPDGKTLASSSDESLRLWDAKTGKERAVAKGFRGPHAWRVPTFMAFSPDGKTVASGTGERDVKLWSADTGEEVALLSGHANVVWAVVYSPDGQLLASGSLDGTIRWWDLATRKELGSVNAHNGWVHCLAITPDGKTLVSCGTDKKLKFWDVTTRQERFVLEGFQEHMHTISVAADGKTVAVTFDREARILDASKAVKP
jgi:WD40 repeat protein